MVGKIVTNLNLNIRTLNKSFKGTQNIIQGLDPNSLKDEIISIKQGGYRETETLYNFLYKLLLTKLSVSQAKKIIATQKKIKPYLQDQTRMNIRRYLLGEPLQTLKLRLSAQLVESDLKPLLEKLNITQQQKRLILQSKFPTAPSSTSLTSSSSSSSSGGGGGRQAQSLLSSSNLRPPPGFEYISRGPSDLVHRYTSVQSDSDSDDDVIVLGKTPQQIKKATQAILARQKARQEGASGRSSATSLETIHRQSSSKPPQTKSPYQGAGRGGGGGNSSPRQTLTPKKPPQKPKKSFASFADAVKGKKP
jgi:hypothetical protein